MSKNKKTNSGKKQKNGSGAQPWISMRSGVIVIAITSLGMAVLTAAQAVPALGWIKGLLWSLFFGVMIWAIFFGMLFVNRFLKR